MLDANSVDPLDSVNNKYLCVRASWADMLSGSISTMKEKMDCRTSNDMHVRHRQQEEKSTPYSVNDIHRQQEDALFCE